MAQDCIHHNSASVAYSVKLVAYNLTTPYSRQTMTEENITSDIFTHLIPPTAARCVTNVLLKVQKNIASNFTSVGLDSRLRCSVIVRCSDMHRFCCMRMGAFYSRRKLRWSPSQVPCFQSRKFAALALTRDNCGSTQSEAQT